MHERSFLSPLTVLLLSALCMNGGSSWGNEILEAAGAAGGLVVHVGCGDGRLTAELRAGDGYLVQGLDTDAGNVNLARQHINSLGTYGKVTAETFDGKRLPYIDNLVNLLVVSDPYDLPEDEMVRVLAPRGVALIAGAGDRGAGSGGERVKIGDTSWRKIVKPWPGNIDQWTHYLHGPDNNAVAHDTVVGPPRHMQWLAAPQWARNHHRLSSISSVVTAAGRLFYILDEATAANINVPGKWVILARDAFSGVTLWKKPLESWAWHQIRFRSGPPQLTRLLVASGDRLFAPLGLDSPVSVIDAVTGETLKTLEDTAGAEEIILAGGILLVLKGAPVAEHAFAHQAFRDRYKLPNEKTLVALDSETGKTLWKWSHPEANPKPETLASDGRQVYLQIGEGVACFDLKSGGELWTYREQAQQAPKKKPRKRRAANKVTYGTNTLVVAEGVVLAKLSGNLTALAAEDGRKLWQCPAGGGFHAPVDVFVIDGLVWQGNCVGDSVSPPPAQHFSEGRDLHSGQIKTTNTVMVDLQTSGHHHRCYREKATDRFIITGKRGIEMMDLAGSEHSRNNWVRGACQYGILPANGLLYAPSHACGCYMESKLRGFWALAAKRDEGRGSRVEGRGSRVEGRGLRVEGRGLRVEGRGLRVEGRGSRVEGRGARDQRDSSPRLEPIPERAPLAPLAGRGVGGEGFWDRLLERGPAYGTLPTPNSPLPSPHSPPITRHPPLATSPDWPMYRHDPLRSGVAGTVVPARLKRAWKARIGGRLTQPVVAGAKLLVAAVDENTVYALDAKTGELTWKHVAGGRVDSPPAVYGNMVLFGSADGRVTCLRLGDGELAWRFLAAPADVRAVAYDRVESLWPVHGSVLVLNGVAYCSAGRSTWLDGGIDLYALDPATGKVLTKTRFQSRHPQFQEGKDQAKPEHETRVDQNTTDYKTFLAPDLSDSFSMAGGTVSDVLVSDGRNVFLHHVKFNARLEKQERMSRHLFSTSSLLDDAENHRSHWVLGTGDFSRIPVAYSWIVNRPGRRMPTIAVPTGVMMVFDEQAVWGARRQGDATGKYHLFKAENRPFSQDEKPLPDFRTVPPEQVNRYVWKNELPVRPRAMLKSGEHLVIGVVPVDVPRDDPYAAYEGRLGGSLWICAEADGSKLAEYPLASPVVWDGMAAAGGKLFLADSDGSLLCFAAAR